MTDLAIIAGTGGLPAAIAAALPEKPYVCALEGYEPDGLTADLTFRVERLVPFLQHLEEHGIRRVTLAGAVHRPRLDPELFDPATAQLVPRLMGAMQGGDDATLRALIGILEEDGLTVEGVETLAPDLIPGAGILAGELTPHAEADAERAAQIVAAIGAVDVGQGCVVAGGLCLAVETLPGTDVMLNQVAALPEELRLKGEGLFYKAAKPGQDRRVDLPVIGVETLMLAANAGLAGIAFEAGSVICVDLPAMQTEAEARGLFLWAR